MKIEITALPEPIDEQLIITQTRKYNAGVMPIDVKKLCVFARDSKGNIIGGIIGKTYWNYLEVSFLWVHEEYRTKGHGSALLSAAEQEALKRGCCHVLLDTFSFQALGFYTKLGYEEFGCLAGFTGNHKRHYLSKRLDVNL